MIKGEKAKQSCKSKRRKEPNEYFKTRRVFSDRSFRSGRKTIINYSIVSENRELENLLIHYSQKKNGECTRVSLICRREIHSSASTRLGKEEDGGGRVKRDIGSGEELDLKRAKGKDPRLFVGEKGQTACQKRKNQKNICKMYTSRRGCHRGEKSKIREGKDAGLRDSLNLLMKAGTN